MTTNFNKKMEKFFDLEPEETENLPQEYIETPPSEFQNLEKDLKRDYEKARDNIDELIEKGNHALDDILSIARESERGRDFEVAATLMKTLLDANESALSLHKQVRDISNYKSNSDNKTTIKNALFVGSTNDLAKMVKDLNKKDIDVIAQ